jgi:hypothetical protein
MTRAFHEEWKKERPSARRRRTAARHGRALGRDIPCRVAPQQSSTPFHPAQVILLDDDEFGIPWGLVLEHGVENHEQLAHTGGENDLGLFTSPTRGGLRQSQSKRPDVFVAAFGAECGHVQRIPDGTAPTANGSNAHELSTIAIEGCHTDQGGNLLAIELSQLGKFSQESRRRRDSDARHGGHEVDLVLPVIVITNEFVDLILNGFDLFFQGFEDILDTLSSGLGGGLFETVRLGRTQVDQLTAAFDELLELSQRALPHIQAAGLDDLTEARQDARVEGIGLGEDTKTFGEIPNLAWIDERNGMAGLEHLGDGHAFESTGRFEDDDTRTGFGNFPDQLAETDVVIRHGKRFGLETERDLERVFGDIHTDVGKLVHGNDPSLRIRARGIGRDHTALAAVRARTKRPTTILLGFGIRFTEG